MASRKCTEETTSVCYPVFRSILFVMLFLFLVQIAPAGEYDRYFGEGWHVTETPSGIIPLSGSVQKAALPIRAYGWKLLSTYRSRSHGQKWYEVSPQYQKWAWKVVIANPFPSAIGCELKFILKTDQGLVLSNPYVSFSSSASSGTTIKPGEESVFTETSSYNIKANKDMGQPSLMNVIVKEWGAATGRYSY